VALAVRATRPGRQNPEQPEEWVLVEAQTTLAQEKYEIGGKTF